MKAIAHAAVLGVGSGLDLLELEDSDLLLAAQALTYEALEFRTLLDERLATMIINKLGEAMG